MMKAAERDQVVELRFAAVGPVCDVVPLADARAIAPGETAASIALMFWYVLRLFMSRD
jgi:hypothetical protein